MWTRRHLLPDLVVGAAYFLAASAALWLTRYDDGVAFLWIAASLLIAVLSVRPRREWGGAIIASGLGSFFATGLFGYGWALALPFAVGNMIEAGVAAALIRYFRPEPSQVGSLPWLGRFLVAVAVAGPLAGAIFCNSALLIAGRGSWMSLLHFYVGHALGNITFIPLITLVLRRELLGPLRQLSQRRRFEVPLMLALVVAVCLLVFGQTTYPMLFLPLLPIILVTFRLGEVGAAISIVLLALIGGGSTLAGEGPMQLIGGPLGTEMQYFQFFLAATVLTILPIAADLRQRGRLHRELRISEERYRLMAEQSSDIILHLETDGTIRYVSPSIRQLGGHDPQALVGDNASVLILPEDRDRVRSGHEATLAARGATFSYDYRAVTFDGEQRWFETHSRAILDEQGMAEGVLSVVRDISSRKANELRLAEAAMTDSLTGLPNRRALRTAIDTSWSDDGDKTEHCLAILDLDYFKRVNDAHGHDIGDAVLCGFARLARSMMRQGDVIARIGGEEFALFLPGTSVAQGVVICDRLREAMAAMVVDVDGQPVSVTLSGGVAAIRDRDVERSFRMADAALYRAKRNGRDQMSVAA